MIPKQKSKKCIGCAIKLTNNLNEEGYTTKDTTENVYCQSCFQIIHYQKPSKHTEETSKDYSLLLKLTTLDKDILICYFLDTFTSQTDFIPLPNNQPTIYIINKSDIIQNYQKDQILNYWKSILGDNVHMISIKYPNNISTITKQFSEYKKIYCIGNTGVGKTTFLQFIAHKNNLTYQGISGPFLNTTKGVMNLKIKNTKIFDFPGTPRTNGYYQLLTSLKIKQFQKNLFKQWIFQIKKNKIININNTIFLEINLNYPPSYKESIIITTSSTLQITSSTKVNNHNNYTLISHKKLLSSATFLFNELGIIEFKFSSPTDITIHISDKIHFTQIT